VTTPPTPRSSPSASRPGFDHSLLLLANPPSSLILLGCPFLLRRLCSKRSETAPIAPARTIPFLRARQQQPVLSPVSLTDARPLPVSRSSLAGVRPPRPAADEPDPNVSVAATPYHLAQIDAIHPMPTSSCSSRSPSPPPQPLAPAAQRRARAASQAALEQEIANDKAVLTIWRRWLSPLKEDFGDRWVEARWVVRPSPRPSCDPARRLIASSCAVAQRGRRRPS
jgi:hypothetical protein